MDQPISNTQPQDDAVALAMARRGLGQQSQQAPDMSGGSMSMGGQPPMPPALPMGAQAPQGKEKFIPKDSHELLVSTLAESLKNEYKLKEEQLKFGQQAPMM